MATLLRPVRRGPAALLLWALGEAAAPCQAEEFCAAGTSSSSSSATPSAACSETEVELAEEQLFDGLRVELLQRDLKHVKAIEAKSAVHADLSDPGVVATPAVPAAAVQEGEAGMDDEMEEEEPTVNCTEYPVFCDAKVNCANNPITGDDRAAWDKQLATADGHPNLRTWCMVYPMYAVSLSKCIVEDHKKEYAQLMYEDQAKNGLTEADAVYCFVAGHCNNTEATEATTQQDAEGMCQSRYGDLWKSVGWADFMGVVTRAKSTMAETAHELEEGKLTWNEMLKIARNETDISAMTSCAMGNYQCDVFYCKANYCENEGYRKRFGNMSWAIV